MLQLAAFVNAVRDVEESVHQMNEQMGNLSREIDTTKRAKCKF